MGIAHGHREVSVPWVVLQNQNISAIYHEVRRKGMTQDMSELTFLQSNIGLFDAFHLRYLDRRKRFVSIRSGPC